MQLVVLDAPTEYEFIVGELPQGVSLSRFADKDTGMAHVFATNRSTLSTHLTQLRRKVGDEASIWVSWPKRASKVATDITEDTIRELALPLGFVDIKVCAVSEIWSGLKLVVRKELRGSSAERIQPVDATDALNISAGVLKASVLRGLSFNCLAMPSSCSCE